MLEHIVQQYWPTRLARVIATAATGSHEVAAVLPTIEKREVSLQIIEEQRAWHVSRQPEFKANDTFGPSDALMSARVSDNTGHDRMGKHEVWRALQRMQKAGLLKAWCWLVISNGLAVEWWRCLANAAYGKVGHGVRFAWVRTRSEAWFEFHFQRDTDPVQPGANTDFHIMLWQDWGRRLAYRVE